MDFPTPILPSAKPLANSNSQQMFEDMKSSAELCPGEHAYALIQGLGLAHLDAHLRDHEHAVLFIEGDLVAHLAERGVRAEEIS